MVKAEGCGNVVGRDRRSLNELDEEEGRRRGGGERRRHDMKPFHRSSSSPPSRTPPLLYRVPGLTRGKGGFATEQALSTARRPPELDAILSSLANSHRSRLHGFLALARALARTSGLMCECSSVRAVRLGRPSGMAGGFGRQRNRLRESAPLAQCTFARNDDNRHAP